MKIIKPGTWHTPWSIEVTCKGCFAALQVEEKDVQPPSSDDDFFCYCMDCGATISLVEKDIHPRVIRLTLSNKTYYGGGRD